MTSQTDFSNPHQQAEEQLSALWDGELEANQAEFLEKRLNRDPKLQQQLARYALIGAAIRQRQGLSVDLVGRVSKGIAAATTSAGELHNVGVESSASRAVGWSSALKGIAIAASVALVGVFILRQAPEWGIPSFQTLTAYNHSPPSPARAVVAGAASGPIAPVSSEHVLHDHLVANRLAKVEREPYSYVTPKEVLSTVPKDEMVRYVAAHVSMTSPMERQDALMHLLADGADE